MSSPSSPDLDVFFIAGGHGTQWVGAAVSTNDAMKLIRASAERSPGTYLIYSQSVQSKIYYEATKDGRVKQGA